MKSKKNAIFESNNNNNYHNVKELNEVEKFSHARFFLCVRELQNKKRKKVLFVVTGIYSVYPD